MPVKLSVVIITKNEEQIIKKAVDSALFASEVLVLDSGSNDKTCQIAMDSGARVEYQEWLGYGMQKNKAIDLASNDWVMVLDSDEVITQELREEITSKIGNLQFDGFYVPRLNNFFGKNIRFGGLYPDYSIRLFNKKKGRFNDAKVHESVIVHGKVGKLKNHMTHQAYSNIDEFINKQKKYAALSIKENSMLKAFASPLWVFTKMYFIRLGFLDGWRGVVIAYVYAKYTFWKYSK